MRGWGVRAWGCPGKGVTSRQSQESTCIFKRNTSKPGICGKGLRADKRPKGPEAVWKAGHYGIWVVCMEKTRRPRRGLPAIRGPVPEQRFPLSNLKDTTWTRAEGAVGLVHIKDAPGC